MDVIALFFPCEDIQLNKNAPGLLVRVSTEDLFDLKTEECDPKA